jgi:hypothetical protein
MLRQNQDRTDGNKPGGAGVEVNSLPSHRLVERSGRDPGADTGRRILLFAPCFSFLRSLVRFPAGSRSLSLSQSFDGDGGLLGIRGQFASGSLPMSSSLTRHT